MQLTNKIFEEVPDAIAESWTHGALVGGMAHGAYSQLAIADSYVRAGDILVESVSAGGDGYELAYPVLFTYRHAIELYLKVVLRPDRRDHPLDGLLTDFRSYVQTAFQEEVPAWFSTWVLEFNTFDPRSTLFRYEDAGAASRRLEAEGEFWIDLRALQKKMEHLRHGFHTVIKKQSC